MPKGTNQKLKLFYLLKIMLEKTDEDHRLTVNEILAELEKYDVTAERKTIYKDMEALEVMDIEIESEKEGRSNYYHVTNRPFELPELKLLVDAIQSSKFITEKKSNELIKKLENLVSKYEARELQRQVYVSGRIKTMNESIYYNVDAIHTAIAENKKIIFQYFQWNVKKEMELRHDGKFYHISPWGLSWDDENYYLVGFDSEAGVIVDRFGKDVMMRPVDKTHFTALVDVAVSRQFIHWVFALGDGAKIVGPEEFVKFAQEEIRRLQEEYLKSVGEYYEQKENN